MSSESARPCRPTGLPPAAAGGHTPAVAVGVPGQKPVSRLAPYKCAQGFVVVVDSHGGRDRDDLSNAYGWLCCLCRSARLSGKGLPHTIDPDGRLRGTQCSERTAHDERLGACDHYPSCGGSAEPGALQP